MKEPKKPSAAFAWLLLIPIQLILDIALIFIGAYLDVSLADTSQPGHPGPGLTIVFTVVAMAFTVIVPVISIIITAVKHHSYKKRYEAYLSGDPERQSEYMSRPNNYHSSDGVYVDRDR